MSIVEGGDWIDITTLLEKTAGDAYSIQNISTGELLLKEAASKPDITDNNGPVLFTPKYKSNSIFNVNNARGKIWGKLVDITRPAILAAGEFVKDKRWVYSFDGVDDRGVLATRAINPDGDIDIEWSQVGIDNTSSVPRCIVTQCASTTVSAREMQLRWQGNSGVLSFIVGGAELAFSLNINNTDGRFRVLYSGSLLSVFKDGALIGSRTVDRGISREPSTFTTIGARNAAGTFPEVMLGVIYDIKINGTLWPIQERNQTIQLPSPSGLGAELITQGVLENPATRGTQWTYLGDGRWQYVGDGSLNVLRFLLEPTQPEQGYLEFEIESLTGQITCSTGAVAGSIFNTIGLKRYFYTTKTNNWTEFKRVGVASCVIKNISFKPLGSCNPLTLVNSNPDRWQEIDL